MIVGNITGCLLKLPYFTVYKNFSLCASFFTAFFSVLLLGPLFIKFANRNLTSKARIVVHKKKDGIPTMGGLLIGFSMLLNMAWWLSPYYWLVSGILPLIIGFSCIGALDDWYKITTHKGIRASTKFFWQISVAILAVIMPLYKGWITFHLPIGESFLLSFVSSKVFLFISFLWALFIIVGYSNAVNLTDGLDGLAVQTVFPIFIAFIFISLYLVDTSTILTADFLRNSAYVAAIISGTLFGFWFFNKHPARIFMGDVGSLMLGALLGLFALLFRFEWLMLLAGIVLVTETVSVMIQMASYALRGKRFFKMAPLHHHLELSGWSEQQITRFATIVSWIGSMSALVLFCYFKHA